MKATELRRVAKRVVEKSQKNKRELFVVFDEEESRKLQAENPHALIVHIVRFSDECQASS